MILVQPIQSRQEALVNLRAVLRLRKVILIFDMPIWSKLNCGKRMVKVNVEARPSPKSPLVSDFTYKISGFTTTVHVVFSKADAI